ncbi:heavy metal translocating P-type ATPase [Flexivirga alba]|uniref:Heavy metal translocating P-type ATPase n=1 Tax=Flexivirga alba TaxID=702742 RepID=A0ABW2AC98_9MICO
MTIESSPREVELGITGMTCASCAMRIEKKLRKIDGVDATVNFATEKAKVAYPEGVSTDDLVGAIQAAGYDASVHQPKGPATAGEPDAEPEDETPALRHRLMVSWALAAPVIVLAMVPAFQFRNWQWLSLVLAAPVVVWGGLPFHRAAWNGLRHRATTMDTLVSMGTIAAFGWSLYTLFIGDAGMPGMRHGFSLTTPAGEGASTIYLEAAAGVTAFLLTGRYLEARSKRSAGAALRALLELGAKQVTVLRDGREFTVPVEELAVGDLFVTRSGEKIATDGEVVEGNSAVDNSAMTGESVPVEVAAGSAVTGSAVNAGGKLVVRATRVGADTVLAQLGRLVEEAQTGKAQVQRLADRVSAIFVPVVLVLALLTFLGWLVIGGSTVTAFTAAVAVLVIACPCALGMATPTALLVGSGRGAQLGLLIKGPEVLENTRTVDTVLLDKTGTVTTGVMRMSRVIPAAGESADEVLALAGSLEHGSAHPIAKAIADAAAERGALAAVEGMTDVGGLGVVGQVDGHAVVVGRPALLQDNGIDLTDELADAMSDAQRGGETVVAVGWNGVARGLIAVADEIKPTSAQAVADLRSLGLRPVLLTGDHEAVAHAVADAVGIDEVIAGVLPADKATVVRDLQAEGRVVAMVGDGVNDAAALAQSDLGIAMGTGTDVAIEASDLTLVRGDLRGAADAIRLSRSTLRVIKSNLVWAFGYNVAAIPLAMSGRLSPMVAGFAMAFSSVFVVLNSLRLRRFRPLD